MQPSTAPNAAALPKPSAQGGVHNAFRRQAVLMIGLSYAIDSALLAGYCALGVTPWSVLVAYVLMATLQCAGFDRAIASGWSRRFRDPSMAVAQMAVGSGIQVLFIALAPEAFAIFAFAAFTLVAFGTLQLTIRANLVAWALITLVVVLTYAVEGERFGVPTDTPGTRVLLVATWALALMRCSFIGSFGMVIREAIRRRQQQAEASALQLTELAQRDALTGALNRRGIMELLEVARARAQAGGPGFSLAILDLDHFKAVNDQHGHLTGDAVLKMAASCVGASLRSGDAMGRYGGEEFLVVLFGLTDTEATLRAADRVRRSMAQQPWGALVPGLMQTASVGVSAHRPGETIEETLLRADAALYQCKHEGRDAVRMV